MRKIYTWTHRLTVRKSLAYGDAAIEAAKLEQALQAEAAEMEQALRETVTRVDEIMQAAFDRHNYGVKAFRRRSREWYNRLEDKRCNGRESHCGDFTHRSKKGRRVGLRGKR